MSDRHDPHRLTAASVLTGPDLDTSWIVAPADAGEHGFTGVAIVELEDPTPYVTEGELLLITGLALPTERTDVARFVDRLADAGIGALGFGVRPVHAEIPAALVAECRRRRLPLLRVGPGLTFGRLSTRVNDLMQNSRLRTLEKTFRTARRLASAAAGANPVRSLVATLSGETSRWVGVRADGFDETAGTLDDAARARIDAWVGARSPESGLVLGRVDDHDVMSTRFQIEDSRIPVRGEVVVAGTAVFTSEDRIAVELACDLLRGALAPRSPRMIAADRLALRLLARATSGGDAEAAADAAGIADAAIGLAGRTTVIAVAAHAVTGPALTEQDLSWWRTATGTPLVDHRGTYLLALAATPPDTASLARLEAAGAVAAVSRAHPVERAGDALVDAANLLPAAVARGRHVRAGAHDLHLLDLVPGHVLTAHARALLAPLDGVAPAERHELRRVLSAWLEVHGAWDPASRALGLHRNTVRRLVARAGELLGTDLEDAAVRAELLFALRADGARIDVAPTARRRPVMTRRNTAADT